MQITIDIDSALVISRAWVHSRALVMEELEQAMADATEYLQGQVGQRSKMRPDGREGAASGKLATSFIASTSVDGDVVFGAVSTPLAYALPVELGTKPHYPPMAPLISWVEQKLKLSGEDAERAALGIQRKIGHHGSVGRFMARDALLNGVDSVRQEFADAAERITARLAQAGGAGAAP